MSTPRGWRWLRWTLLGAIAALLVGAGLCWKLGSLLVAPMNHLVTLPADFQAASIAIPGHGHRIAGSWRDLGGNSPVVLLLHGVRADRASMVPHARLLVAAGFSVLMIDQQAHGETPGDRITLGWRESADARAARDWIRANAPGRRVGVIGTSLGGASVLLGSQPAGFDAVVLESVYPRVTRAVDNRLRMRLGTPGAWLSPLLLLQLKPRLGVTADQLEPVRHIGALGAPVLVVGGARDSHTTEDETRELYSAARAPKELWIVENAVHQDLARFDAAAYQAHVIDFLRRHLQAGN